MRYIKLYEQFRIFEAEESLPGVDIKEINFEELPKPSKQILLDGTSSSGKSVALKELSSDWCVLAADEFYDLIGEDLGKVNFGNEQKISEVYTGCPYKFTEPSGDNYEFACRWYMAQEVKFGKVKSLGMVSRNKNMGRSSEQKNIIYDDVQGTILNETKKVGLSKPKWILVHAPIDHLISNILRRPKDDQRDPEGVFCGAYCFKYEAKPQQGGVDPEKSWTKSSVKELLKGQPWVDTFLDKVGIKEDGIEYWMHVKDMPEGKYDVIVNTRNKSGNQMTIEEVASEVKKNF
jgi:chloramphenicol 3-O-phosphotransferase